MGVRQSRELQAEWQHKYMSIQAESAIMKHELDDVSLHSQLQGAWSPSIAHKACNPYTAAHPLRSCQFMI